MYITKQGVDQWPSMAIGERASEDGKHTKLKVNLIIALLFMVHVELYIYIQVQKC